VGVAGYERNFVVLFSQHLKENHKRLESGGSSVVQSGEGVPVVRRDGKRRGEKKPKKRLSLTAKNEVGWRSRPRLTAGTRTTGKGRGGGGCNRF